MFLLFQSRWTVNGILLTFCNSGVALDTTLDITDPQVIKAFNEAKQIYPCIQAIAILDDLNGRWDENYIRHAPDSVIDDLMGHVETAKTARSVTIPESVQWIINVVHDEHAKRTAKRQAKTRKARRAAPGFVYLIQSPTGTFKIGKARNVEDRMRLFGVKLPFEVTLIHTIQCQNYHVAESQIHTRFAAKRINGSEFFALTDEDVAWIKAIENL